MKSFSIHFVGSFESPLFGVYSCRAPMGIQISKSELTFGLLLLLRLPRVVVVVVFVDMGEKGEGEGMTNIANYFFREWRRGGKGLNQKHICLMATSK